MADSYGWPSEKVSKIDVPFFFFLPEFNCALKVFFFFFLGIE